MKAVLYSGGDHDDNYLLDEEVLRLIGRSRPCFTFIPSCIDDAEEDFEYFLSHFRPCGVYDFVMFPIDSLFTNDQLDRALRSDFVFLDGGNTFYFLKHLRKSGMISHLRKYLLSGGVLGGLSAGAIIMTPNINTARFPYFDCDINDVNIKNYRGMNLFNFEFFPHYSNSRRYIHELDNYSKNLSYPVYACPDGSGVVISDKGVNHIGPQWGFMRGKKFKIHP